VILGTCQAVKSQENTSSKIKMMAQDSVLRLKAKAMINCWKKSRKKVKNKKKNYFFFDDLSFARNFNKSLLRRVSLTSLSRTADSDNPSA